MVKSKVRYRNKFQISQLTHFSVCAGFTNGISHLYRHEYLELITFPANLFEIVFKHPVIIKFRLNVKVKNNAATDRRFHFLLSCKCAII